MITTTNGFPQKHEVELNLEGLLATRRFCVYQRTTSAPHIAAGASFYLIASCDELDAAQDVRDDYRDADTAGHEFFAIYDLTADKLLEVDDRFEGDLPATVESLMLDADKWLRRAADVEEYIAIHGATCGKSRHEVKLGRNRAAELTSAACAQRIDAAAKLLQNPPVVEQD